MIAQGYSSEANREWILSQVSEEAILQYYINIDKIPCVTNSPLRVDNKPSFGLYYSTNGIGFKDYTTGDRGNLMDLLQQLFMLSPMKTLERIIKDLPHITLLDKHIIKRDYTKTSFKHYSNRVKTHKQLNVIVRDWQIHDLEYWEKAGITLPWLNFGQVYPISHIFINSYLIKAEKYAYVYVEYKSDIPTYKIYQPFSTDRKWLNNHGASVWDLWAQLPEQGEELIITSSRKDALCLWENLGIPSVSLQAEGYLPKESIVDILKSRFNHIYVLYDNDFTKTTNYGRELGKKLADLYKLTQIEIPEIYKAKDPSDLFSKLRSSKSFYKILINIIKK